MLIQPEGNMVVFRGSDGRVSWSTGTHGRGGYIACMQSDGNFALRNNAGSTIWQTNTHTRGGDYAFLQDDGQLSIRASTSATVWNSGPVMGC